MSHKTGVRITHPPELIAKARALYIAGDLTIAEIGERLGVSANTITTWRQRDRWADLPRKRVPLQRSDYVPRANISPAQRANIAAQKAIFAVRRQPSRPPTPEEAEHAVAEWLARGNKPTVCEPGYAVVPERTILPSYGGGARL